MRLRKWNGRDFYVILGMIKRHNRWEVCRRYGLLLAGGGPAYSKPLGNLQPGHRVFAYLGGAGYVGIGTVTDSAMLFRDVLTEGAAGSPVVDEPDIPDWLRQHALAEDPDFAEHAVPVTWAADVDEAEAIGVSEHGLFSSQLTVCKLRHGRTIEVVAGALLDGEDDGQ